MLAIVRAVPESLGRCQLTWQERRSIDVPRARAQHAAYVDALRASGLDVTVLPADEAHPDCPFVEDVLLDLGGVRVLTATGAPSRRGEREAVAAAVPDAIAMPDALRLDGGDVLQVGGRVFVGLSTRTDPAAVAWLEGALGRPVERLVVPGALHLKTVLSAVDDRTLLAAPGAPRPAGFDVLEVPAEDAAAANVLRLPDGSVLAPAGFPATLALLAARGARVRPVGLSEFHKAEAGPTCLSVLLQSA